jgi:putative NADH-flavin reductase
MGSQKTFLVFGATGQTGQHFVSRALADGNKVRALARNPDKLAQRSPDLARHKGAIPDVPDLDELLDDVDYVVSMLGDIETQKHTKINTAFVQNLIPAMRRQGVARFLYQAGGLSSPPHQRLSPVLWTVRQTLAGGYKGQHEDNEAAMEYLESAASDIEWMVHRAGIGSDGPSKGTLQRSTRLFSVATFTDCAEYNYRTVMDSSAIHTASLSRYGKS